MRYREPVAGKTNGVDLLRGEPGLLSEIARQLGISRGAVAKWQVIPAGRVVAIERATGIPRELLRPDLYRRRHGGKS